MSPMVAMMLWTGVLKRIAHDPWAPMVDLMPKDPPVEAPKKS